MDLHSFADRGIYIQHQGVVALTIPEVLSYILEVDSLVFQAFIIGGNHGKKHSG